MIEFGHLLTDAPAVGAIMGTVEVVHCARDSESPWAIPGQWHWILDDPQPLPEPIPCEGRSRIVDRAPPDERDPLSRVVNGAKPGAHGVATLRVTLAGLPAATRASSGVTSLS